MNHISHAHEIDRRIKNKRQCLHPCQDYAIKKRPAAVREESDIKQDHTDIIWAAEKSLNYQIDQWILSVDKLRSLGSHHKRRRRGRNRKNRGVHINPNIQNVI